WSWVYTVWMTNWLDPDTRHVRIALIVLMLIGLLMSTSLTHAFDGRALLFATAYVAGNVGRSLFILSAFRETPHQWRNFQRIISWQITGGVFWLAGGFADGSTRDLLWIIALTVEMAGPAAGFFVPRLGRSYTSEWTVAGDHFAERCELFLILSLGESILVTGATVSELEFAFWTMVAFTVAFIGSVAFWWVYFDRGAEASSEIISHSDDSGRLARSAYTYFHLPMVAGIILAAVGDELSIAHPRGETDTATAAVILGGPALFLAGHTLYKLAIFGYFSRPRLAGIAALILLIPVASVTTPVALAALATTVIIGISIADVLHYRAMDVGEQPAPAHD
ncbi:MAG TPA: low temperature requirement protein A, partial [Thermomicrobiales bacterium]|nr:low temperature requirement protein A [Thermomicrobiales bacterium]